MGLSAFSLTLAVWVKWGSSDCPGTPSSNVLWHAAADLQDRRAQNTGEHQLWSRACRRGGGYAVTGGGDGVWQVTPSSGQQRRLCDVTCCRQPAGGFWGFSSEAVRGYANMIAHSSSSTQLGPWCLLLSIRKERSLYREKSLGKLSLYFEAVRAFLYVCALFLCLFLCIGSGRPPRLQFIEQYSKLDSLRYDWKEKLSKMWRGRKGKWVEDLPSCQPPRATLSELIRQNVIGQNLCWVPLRYSGSNICFYSNIQKKRCLEALQKILFIFFPFQLVIYTTLTPTSLSLRNK